VMPVSREHRDARVVPEPVARWRLPGRELHEIPGI
jgi:hypothetical protein